MGAAAAFALLVLAIEPGVDAVTSSDEGAKGEAVAEIDWRAFDVVWPAVAQRLVFVLGCWRSVFGIWSEGSTSGRYWKLVSRAGERSSGAVDTELIGAGFAGDGATDGSRSALGERVVDPKASSAVVAGIGV